MSFHFRDGEALARGAVRIARDQVARAIDGLKAGAGSGDPDAAVHQARKRIKKARAVLRLAGASVGRKRARKVNRRLRDAARPLGEARDASALVATVDAISRAVPPGEADEARKVMAGRREAVHRRDLGEGETLARAVASLRAARRRIGRLPVGDDSEPADGLRRSFKAGRAAFEAALNDPTPESCHEWRKRVKDLAYQLEAIGGDPGGHLARLQDVAGLLGELHDLDVLVASLPPAALGPIAPEVEARRRDFRRLALMRGSLTFRAKPRAFVRGIAATRAG